MLTCTSSILHVMVPLKCKDNVFVENGIGFLGSNFSAHFQHETKIAAYLNKNHTNVIYQKKCFY